MYNLYINATTQDKLCTFVHTAKLTGVGRVLPPFIFGEAHYVHFLQLKVGQAVPLHFLSHGPPRASSPPGAHVRGELSQLSMAYRYLS